MGFYSDKLNITPKYLSKIVKDISGKSAAEWIYDYVILEAKTLLKFSGMSIHKIAYNFNFSLYLSLVNISNTRRGFRLSLISGNDVTFFKIYVTPIWLLVLTFSFEIIIKKSQ